ncbi:MAG: hypothetical protein NTU47_04735, partial [Ignavibacteriales bacterium]|nr:hypothetical protein [Ignavibacteriales bacterium]
MTIFIDLLGSWIIRASLITVMLTLTVSLNNALYQSNQQANAKKMIVAADSIIYSDVNMAGYNVSGVSFAIASDTVMQFAGDVNGGGTPETIKYWTSYNNATGLRKLYRYVNNENGGVDLPLGNNFYRVSFQYYNYFGKKTTRLDSIVAVRVCIVRPEVDRVDLVFTLQSAFQVSSLQDSSVDARCCRFRLLPRQLLSP